MNTWPEHLRIREMPAGIRKISPATSTNLVQISQAESATNGSSINVPVLAIRRTTEWLRDRATDKSDPARSALALINIEGLVPGSGKGEVA
jgi:hypothetical protein